MDKNSLLNEIEGSLILTGSYKGWQFHTGEVCYIEKDEAKHSVFGITLASSKIYELEFSNK